MQLYQKWRPKTWAEFIGQEPVIARVRALIERPGFGEGGGEALLISGPSGTGKTTLAWLIARALGCDDWSVIELDGEACTVDRVRDLDNNMWLTALGGRSAWRAWIVNECHSITHKAAQAFLTLLERIPARRLFVFTTTEDVRENLFGRFTGPFASRCTCVKLTNQGLAQAFASRAREIADAEGLNGKPASAYVRLVQDCHNNMRAVLQRIGAGEMTMGE